MTLAPFAVAFACALVVLCLCERLLHALLSLFFVRAGESRRAAAGHLMQGHVLFWTTLASRVAVAALQSVRRLLAWWLVCLAVFGAFAVLNATWEEYPETWQAVLGYYNRSVGPFLQQAVVIPLVIADLFLKSVLPLWDALVWFWRSLVLYGVLPVVSAEARVLLDIAQELVLLCQDSAVSLVAFAESFLCTQGLECLALDKRVLNVLTPMGRVRNIALRSVNLTTALCSSLAVPADLAIYPLTDVNVALGVHFLVNAGLHLLLVAPQVTSIRCASARDNAFHVLQCTPDLEPVMQHLGAALNSLGLALDNWLDVALVVVEGALTGAPVRTCGDASQQQERGLDPSVISGALFAGSNRSIPVGLTESLYAVTDGATAVYVGTTLQSVQAPQLWPHPVNVDFGVAAVSLSKDPSPVLTETRAAVQTTDMLGCNCTDTADSGMVVLCTILPLEGMAPNTSAADYTLQVFMPDALVAGYLRCDGVRIVVRSVRWRLTRYSQQQASLAYGETVTAAPSTDCVSRGNCREVDATVWLLPRCAETPRVVNDRACLAGAVCNPFCMAARPSGSGRGNLFFLGQGRWRTGSTLLERDCAVGAAESPQAVTSTSGGSGFSATVTTLSPLLQNLTSALFVQAASQATPRCNHTTSVTSFQPAPEGVRSGLLSGDAPFVVAGDTVFTPVPKGGGFVSVAVERLFGDERNVFSLQTLAQQLPAELLLATQLEQGAKDDVRFPGNPVKLLVPSSASMLVAVSSDDFVFYASNPTPEVLGAYFRYCARGRRGDDIPQWGLLIESSYAALQVFRVAAYRRCAAYSCGADLVRSVELAGFKKDYSVACDQRFNASVVNLEYVDAHNVAVTVKVANVTDYSEMLGDFDGPGVLYRTYWLHPRTLALAASRWTPTAPRTSYGVLCPSQMRLPQLGSMGAELANAGLFLVRFVSDAVLYTPGMVPVWRAGGVCASPGASNSLYHTAVATCGADLYGLDDFFDSLDGFNSLFWDSLRKLEALLLTSEQRRNFAGDLFEGAASFGAGSVDAALGASSVVTLNSLPIKDALAGLLGSFRDGLNFDSVTSSAAVGSAGGQQVVKVSAGLVAWARFTYGVGRTMFLALLRRQLSGEGFSLEDVWTLLWTTLYDQREVYNQVIVAKYRRACFGLQLMLGYDNPVAKIVYYQCLAGGAMVDSVLDVALDVFVHVPMAKCVCKDGVGQRQPLTAYVQSVCLPRTPVSLRPTLLQLVNAQGGGGLAGGAQFARLTCQGVLGFTKARLRQALDPWLDYQYKALAALGDLVDYLLIGWKSDAGECLNLQDPHVFVIVPQPNEYFSKCADTSLCHRRCAREWALFEPYADGTQTAPLPVVEVTVESMFFPGDALASSLVTNVVALAEVDGAGTCDERASAALADYAVAVAQSVGCRVLSEFCCLPRRARTKRQARGFCPWRCPARCCAPPS